MTKKCRNMGQCIPGLKAKLVSASLRHRSQPAGLVGEGAWSWCVVCRRVPRLSKLAWVGFSVRRRNAQSAGITWPGRTAITTSWLRDLGRATPFSEQ